MASLINIEDLTINPEEAKEIGQLIIEKEFVQSELARIHDIETGILYKAQIPFAGKLADSLKKASGCTPNPGSGVEMTEKFWDPEIFDSRWIHCAADLNKLFKLFEKAKRINPDFYDRIDSQEMGIIYSLISQMLRENLPLKIWFSDKNASTFEDSDGSNAFTNGTDVALYDVIDGLFKQIFAEVNSGTPENYVAIAKNAGESYAEQALVADEALDIFTSMVNKADSRLLGDATAQILATRSLADNYKDSLRTKNLGAGFLEVVENGRPQLFFDNIPIVVMHEWDRTIKSIQNNGTIWNLPHRAILTTPSNIPVGTLATEDLETLDSFYDRTLKSNIVDVAFSLDAKFLEDYMTVAAY